MVVHPAYWNRGHGSTLARWGVKLAQMDHVDQGVIATSMGVDLFKHIGFDQIAELQVGGDEKTPEGVRFDALKYVVPDKDTYSEQSEL
jgi:N-acetylglutamate synthase-like GNAT family acetyltransferase